LNQIATLFPGDGRGLEGDYLDGDSLPRLGDSPLIGEDSLSSLPTRVFCTAIFSENFLRGSFLSNFSNSAGVY
jgi:hypothetical protein